MVTTDPTGMVRYKSSEQPTHIDCDNVVNGQTPLWNIEWQADPNENGYIIQRVEFLIQINWCNGRRRYISQPCPINGLTEQPPTSQRALPNVYWELWYVQNGTILQSLNKGAAGFPDDNFQIGMDLRDDCGTRGWIEIRAVAYFVAAPGDLANQQLPGGNIWSVDPDGPAGVLMQTCNSAAIRKIPGLRRFADRRMIASWDCCECPPVDDKTRGITIARINSGRRVRLEDVE